VDHSAPAADLRGLLALLLALAEQGEQAEAVAPVGVAAEGGKRGGV
jgi:hypothetical protein